MLRNPIDRTYSAYRMEVRRGRERRDFAAVVAEQVRPEHAERARSLPWASDDRIDTYVVTSEYGRLLEDWYGYLPRERLLVLFTETYAERTGTELDRVLEFLGLAAGFRPPNLDARYNVGSRSRDLRGPVRWLRAAQLPRLFWRLLPKARRDGVLRWYWRHQAVDSAPGGKPDRDSVELLRRHFRPDVERLGVLVGRTPPWPDLVSG